jgi:hypothetical protein
MPLARFDAPFEHPDWIFEPKLDGFRAVAYVERDAVQPGDRARGFLQPPEGARIAHLAFTSETN